MPQTLEMSTFDGTDVEIELVKPLPGGGQRIDVTSEDGRRWKLDVDRNGGIDPITTWRHGTLADVDIPDWMGDVIAQLQRRG
ncbi:hypothetical protein U3A55_12045 [Salarchaeum sp. III]|uniref:hypothetical protein n=1 Tax=Salarchaeum sp. III TaxID=3107927 RepID=UPI002EDA67F0